MASWKKQDIVYDTNNLEWGIGTIVFVNEDTIKVKYDNLEKLIGYNKRVRNPLIHGVRPKND